MTAPQPWPFAADWSNPILETLEWLTAIQTSPIGAEQRQALRNTPRRMIDMPFLLGGQERAYFDVLMAANSGAFWTVPIPHEAVALGPLFHGVSTFNFDTTLREFYTGGYVLLVGDPFRYEVLEVTSVSATGLVLGSPVLNDYPGGATLAPTFVGKITDVVTTARKTARFMTGTIRFQSMQPNPWPVGGRTIAAPTFTQPSQSIPYPVLTQEPNGIDDLDYTYERLLQMVDNQTSIPAYTDKALRVFNTQKYAWFLYGRQERQAFRDLLFSLRGRCNPVWVPTFNDDLAPGFGYVDPTDLTGGTPPPDRELVIQFLRDGTFGIYPISRALGVPVEVFAIGNIWRTSFLSLKRLDVDRIEFQHYGNADGVATVTAIFRDAPDLRTPLGLNALPFNEAGFLDEPTAGSVTTATNPAIAITTPLSVTSGV